MVLETLSSLKHGHHRAAHYNEASVAKSATARRATVLGSSAVIYARGHQRHRARAVRIWRKGAPGPGPTRHPGGRRCVLLSQLRESLLNPPLGVAAVVCTLSCIHGVLAVASSNPAGWALLPGYSCASTLRRSLFRGRVHGCSEGLMQVETSFVVVHRFHVYNSEMGGRRKRGAWG